MIATLSHEIQTRLNAHDDFLPWGTVADARHELAKLRSKDIDRNLAEFIGNVEKFVRRLLQSSRALHIVRSYKIPVFKTTVLPKFSKGGFVHPQHVLHAPFSLPEQECAFARTIRADSLRHNHNLSDY
jgi:hypothetical protein